MKISSEIAEIAFAETLEWAKKYGKSQVDHHFKTLTERFNEEAIIALGAGLIDDLRKKRNACLEMGVIDQFQDKAVEFSAITLPNGEGISVRFQEGDNLLFAWEDDEKSTLITAIPWRDEAPDQLVNELHNVVENGITYSELKPLAQQFGAYSVLQNAEGKDVYSEQPETLPKIIQRLQTNHLKNVGFAFGLGYCKVTRGVYGIETWDGGRGRNHQVVEFAKRIASKLNVAKDIQINRGAAHLVALGENRLEALFASSCAAAFDYHLRSHLAEIQEIVLLSEEIGLSSELVFAHNDKDIHVYGQRFGNRDLYVNFNLDSDDDTYATVISNEDGKPVRVDVYMATSWGQSFDSYFGCDIDETVRPDLAPEFVEYVTSERPITTEIDLVASLKAGGLPEKGLAYSYDIPSKTIEVTPLGIETRYLGNLPLDVSTDLERLKAAINGEEDKWIMGFKRRLENGDTDDIEVEGFFANKRTRKV